METHTLYNGLVEIEFNPNRHTAKLKGEKTYLTSVTGATGIINKPFLIPWAVGLATKHLFKYLESSQRTQFTAEELMPVIYEAGQQHELVKTQAAAEGTMAHDWAMQFAKSKIEKTATPEIPEKGEFTDEQYAKVINSINAFIDWYAKHDVTFLMVEKMVYSQKYHYYGFLDCFAIVDGKRTVIDYKTSNSIYSEMRYQVEGYKIAVEEEYKEPVELGMLLRFPKDQGSFEATVIEPDESKKNRKAFLACLTVKEREKEVERELRKLAKY